MKEEWRAVVGFEGKYEVSDMGRVRSLPRLEPYRRHPGGHLRMRRGGILKGGRSGIYRTVRLPDGTHMVHVLVLTAFVGPCPPGWCACHFPDQSGSNNRLKNLRWGTYKENNDERIMRSGR